MLRILLALWSCAEYLFMRLFQRHDTRRGHHAFDRVAATYADLVESTGPNLETLSQVVRIYRRL